MATEEEPADALFAALQRQLTPEGATWLDDALARVRSERDSLAALFPAVRRRCGGAPLAGVPGWTIDEAARALLLRALPLDGADLAAAVEAVYRHGDTRERLGVLRSLPLLDLGSAALPVVEDALRSNDTRLIAAALGPYAARHLGASAWRHGVLKCIFVGIPLAEVAGLPERGDRELARMLADFAVERRAAGRPVPGDLWTVLDRFPTEARAARTGPVTTPQET